MCELNAHPVSTALVQIAPYQGVQGCLRPGACFTLSRVKIHHPAKILHSSASASGSALTLPASPARMMPAAAPLCLRVEEQPRGAVACLPADGQDVLQGAVVAMRDRAGGDHNLVYTRCDKKKWFMGKIEQSRFGDSGIPKIVLVICFLRSE